MRDTTREALRRMLRQRLGEKADEAVELVERVAALFGIDRLPRVRAFAVLSALVAGVLVAHDRSRGAPLGEVDVVLGWRACKEDA